jgi:hypothetical protein
MQTSAAQRTTPSGYNASQECEWAKKPNTHHVCSSRNQRQGDAPVFVVFVQRALALKQRKQRRPLEHILQNTTTQVRLVDGQAIAVASEQAANACSHLLAVQGPRRLPAAKALTHGRSKRRAMKRGQEQRAVQRSTHIGPAGAVHGLLSHRALLRGHRFTQSLRREQAASVVHERDQGCGRTRVVAVAVLAQ